MAHVSHKLSNAFEGALAAGGDPATSPLYVFGPFLRLIVVAGVAEITFGASIWLVVITVAAVSAMYRSVMRWIVDGSGGSGLSEEEFGGWAVKLNAGITFVEYTLTFLVSMAALVTFIADRIPAMNDSFLGLDWRTYIAIALSILTGWTVNRGPKVAARAFGPATAGVLLLLWTMMVATVVRSGLRLPSINFQAFNADNLRWTVGGYVRILALMTGIEIFANLVPAYKGKRAEKSRKAFNSLLIIMGTTAMTMLIVGPAILDLSDPTDEEVSVFTQTMDALLPEPLALLGTFVGVAVLLSASAASAMGLQNLFVGLKLRHYVPAVMGRLNRFGVAGAPVWLEVAIVSVSFLLVGTNEETYLALYAAGVFILLSMTGWAAAKRLIRSLRQQVTRSDVAVLVGALLAAVLTTVATIIIFVERFEEGAWIYLILLPLLYFVFGYFRRELGTPTPVEERVGASVAGAWITTASDSMAGTQPDETIRGQLVPLDGSQLSAQVLPMVEDIAKRFGGGVTLLTVGEEHHRYTEAQAALLRERGIDAVARFGEGSIASAICDRAQADDVEMIVMSTRGLSGARRLLVGSVATEVMQMAQRPVLLAPEGSRIGKPPRIDRAVVALDGSPAAERVVGWTSLLAREYGSSIDLVHATVGVTSAEMHAAMERYLAQVEDALSDSAAAVTSHLVAANPALALLEVAQSQDADLIILASHGRGGLEKVLMGSVADQVVTSADRLVLLVPVLETRSEVPVGASTGTSGSED